MSDLPCGGRAAAIARTRQRMAATGQWHDSQLLGRRGPIGCVALEITQRCNLDINPFQNVGSPLSTGLKLAII